MATATDMSDHRPEIPTGHTVALCRVDSRPTNTHDGSAPADWLCCAAPTRQRGDSDEG